MTYWLPVYLHWWLRVAVDGHVLGLGTLMMRPLLISLSQEDAEVVELDYPVMSPLYIQDQNGGTPIRFIKETITEI